MRRYDSYIDSGIEVLGKVPSSWKKSKFKFQHFEQDERVGEDSTEYDLLSLTKKGIILRDIESGKGKFPESFDTYKKVKKDDLIFCLYDIEETPRTVGLSELNGMITGSYKIFNSKDVISKFTYYTFLVIDDVKGLKPYYTGLRNVVRPETFKSLPFFIPPLSEQQQIISFLDTKTSLIDSLIEKTHRKIELLKEKRTSLINEVVTKGLNSNLEMKDSGVEWIGEIPSHWKKTKVKYISDVVRGSILRPVDEPLYFDENGEWTYLNISDVSKVEKFLNYGKLRLSELGSTKSRRVEPNNLIITGSGTVGKVFINTIPVCVHDGFIPILNLKVNINFMFYYLINPNLYVGIGKTNSQKNIYLDEVKEMDISIPSDTEQEKIVEYLDEQTGLIDKTISIEEKRIELLKEYRQSLISEVVTGKRKVV